MTAAGRRWWLRIILVLCSLAFSLAAAEIGFRVRAHLINRGLLRARDFSSAPLPANRHATLVHLIQLSAIPELIYELRPGLDVLYKGAEVHTNSDGFRGPEVQTPRRPGVGRILGLGDSFMFGHGVADDEVYLARLRQRLGEDRLEVVNTAVPGYNTVLEVETLRRKGLKYRPDVVIVDWVGNDLSLPNFIRVPYPVLDFDHSFLWDRVRQTLLEPSVDTAFRVTGLFGLEYRDPRGLAFSVNPDEVPRAYRHMVGWHAFERAMRELAELAAANDFDVLWMTLDPGEGALKARATAVAVKLGFPILDIGASLRSEALAMGYRDFEHSPLALSAEDSHPNARAHAIAGELLAGALRARFVITEEDSDRRSARPEQNPE